MYAVVAVLGLGVDVLVIIEDDGVAVAVDGVNVVPAVVVNH